jgi:selenocysteine lyase/cysteine desulfurase
MTATLGRTIDHATSTALREEFPILREYTYLNCASQGPLPDRTARAAERAIRLSQVPHSREAVAEPPAEAVARTRLARLIGADEQDLLWTGNTTHGMNICAQGIEWRPGDNVVIPANEFPSLSYTWYNLTQRGVEVRIVPFNGAGPSVGNLMDAVDSRTRAVSCSAITWTTGWRANLEDLGAACAKLGVLLILDGIQAIGARRLDVKAMRISAISTHGYKWLLSGFGLGALYVSPEAQDRITPTFIGSQATVASGEDFEPHLTWKPGAARYGAGGINRVGLATLAASLGLIEEVGIDRIEDHDRALAEQLYAALERRSDLEIVSSADPEHRSAVIVFSLGSQEKNAALVKRLEEQNIIVALRPLGVRVSPHFYNTEDDIARLLAALD